MSGYKEFLEKRATMSNGDLVELCEEELRKMCITGGKSFRTSIPLQVSDTDILFAELVRRFKDMAKLRTAPPHKLPSIAM